MDDRSLNWNLTAKENAERRTLWTREEVFGMLRMQSRDDDTEEAWRIQALLHHGHRAQCADLGAHGVHRWQDPERGSVRVCMGRQPKADEERQ